MDGADRGDCRDADSQAEELRQLHLLCQQGRLYEVEEWIQQGRVLQLPLEPGDRSRKRSALPIALATGQYSLCQLLLRSGYGPDEDIECPFDIALSTRRPDLVDLLFEFRG